MTTSNRSGPTREPKQSSYHNHDMIPFWTKPTPNCFCSALHTSPECPTHGAQFVRCLQRDAIWRSMNDPVDDLERAVAALRRNGSVPNRVQVSSQFLTPERWPFFLAKCQELGITVEVALRSEALTSPDGHGDHGNERSEAQPTDDGPRDLRGVRPQGRVDPRRSHRRHGP